MNVIFKVIKKVLLSLSPQKSLIEGVFKADFKLGVVRENLMQISFSSLAVWPLIIAMLLLSLTPLNNSWSLVKLFSSDSRLVFFLLDGHTATMLTVFALAFILEWIFRQEFFLILIVVYFLNRSELHLNLALSAVLGILLSRISYFWWLAIDSVSEVKLIWNRVHQLQFVSWLCTATVFLFSLDYVQRFHLINTNGFFSRINFIILLILFFHFFNFIFLSGWGHFYFKRKTYPDELPVYYSTSMWLLRVSISDTLSFSLQTEILKQIESHQTNLKKYAELKLERPGLANFPIESVLNKELEYLKEAKLRLSKV